MPTSNDYSIGVFDSGLGGLTVVKELMRQLPKENIVYFGDTARVPYGTKSKEVIKKFSKENTTVLLKQKVKLIVVACNTSSSLALDSLKKNFSLPIIGVINPGVKKAVGLTKAKRIGVIATPATIESNAYGKRIRAMDRSIKVRSKACPLFVPLAEEGRFNSNITTAVAKEYLENIKTFKADTLILGCTHYPLLKSVLRKVMGKKVKLVDSAQEVAAEARDFLRANKKIRTSKGKGRYKFFVSDEPEHFRRLAKNFLGYNVKNVKRYEYV